MEAFVNSGGNAILRTADGNLVSSGIGSGLSGYSSSAEFMGTTITVGSSGQVSTNSFFHELPSLFGTRAVSSSFGSVVGGAGTTKISTSRLQSFTRIGVKSGGRVTVRVISTNYGSSGSPVVISTTTGGSAVGTSGGSGSAGGGGATGGGSAGGGGGGTSVGGGSGSSGGGVVVGGGSSGVSGGSGVGVTGGVITGATILGGAASADSFGEIKAYGTTLTEWTLLGATTDGAKQIEVIGDFGGQL